MILRDRTIGRRRSDRVRAPTSPPGVVHDWWQVGDEDAQALVEVSPGVRFVEVVGTMFGLARDGKVNAKGMPGPLQLAVMGHE